MIAWALLSGCIQTVYFPPDLWAWDSGTCWDTGRPCGRAPGEDTATGDDDDSSIRVTEITSGCDLDNTSFVTEIWTSGWVGSATLNMVRTSDLVTEEHPFTLVQSAPNGDWDHLRAGPLVAGVPPESFNVGQNTQFSCSEDLGRLSWVVRLHDGAGSLLDCVVWGDDPTGATAQVREIDPDIVALGGCRVPNETPLSP